MTGYERETIINYNDGEKTVNIYTASPSVMHRLDKLCAELPDTYREVDIHTVQGEVVAKDYMCSDKKLVRLAKPRVLSDKQRAVLDKMHSKSNLSVETRPGGAEFEDETA